MQKNTPNKNISLVLSPLTKSDNVIKIKTIKKEKIIDLYKSNFNINIAYLLNDILEVELFECIDTGYQFYYPFNIAGDGIFYERLQQFDWYYMPWKWEHEIAFKFLAPNIKVLEIGCGKGAFIYNLQKNNCVLQAVGLELNEDAVSVAISKGLKVYSEKIEKHAASHFDQYDMVCSFQVLEHISEVYSFLESSLKCLKKDGLLVIGVPNNNSFVRWYADEDLLNMPPHHMGLWTPSTLKNLEKYFSITLVKLKNEPLQQYHFDWYCKIVEQKILLKSKKLYSILCSLGFKNILKLFVTKFYFLIDGHTTVAVFQKN